ncbi:hypothetical protein GCM10023322_83320 [Rugosimonospora acidiphila]|uniref:Uncharacterized protein n=1 Tax=Rugosimonospora acidiphila TaxID=556531 RepID=A0ABP9SSS3_9ACTN
MLLDEYERWTGDAQVVRDFEFEARAALTWIDEYADLMGLGYIAYQRRNEETGLKNQCWKDSWDAVAYRDGHLPSFPRATCELQGYAYDAKMRGPSVVQIELLELPKIARTHGDFGEECYPHEAGAAPDDPGGTTIVHAGSSAIP